MVRTVNTESAECLTVFVNNMDSEIGSIAKGFRCCAFNHRAAICSVEIDLPGIFHCQLGQRIVIVFAPLKKLNL